MKIVADNKIPFLEGVLEPFFDVVYLPGNEISREDLLDADALIIRTRTKCNQDLLHGTSVKFIATATIGFDHIDTNYCTKYGVEWTNAAGCNSGSVQQWFMASILYYASINNIDLTTKTLGVVGVGNVGSKIVRFAEVLGMRILLNDPPRAREEGTCGFVNLDSICRESDIITFHVPLIMEGSDRTYHLVNSDLIRKMINGCLLFNSSRGEVIRSDDLITNCLSKKIAPPILDVWENEPRINLDLLGTAFLATPHIAGYSADGKANGTAMSVAAVCRFFNIPIEDWYPENISETENLVVRIDAKKKTFQKVLTEAILATYNIKRDDKSLRSDSNAFEYLRGSYPIRRESHAWTIILENSMKDYDKRLSEIGFKVELIKNN